MLLMRDPGFGLGPLMLMMRAFWVVHGYPKIAQKWGRRHCPSRLLLKQSLQATARLRLGAAATLVGSAGSSREQGLAPSAALC